MTTRPMWMVRAEGGALYDEFKEKSAVAMGLNIGALDSTVTRADIAARIRAQSPMSKDGHVVAWAGMLHRFRNEVAIGDAVVTYEPSRRVYLLGTISGECRYDDRMFPRDPFVRSVKWRGEAPRDALAVASKNSLGATSTFFRIPTEVVVDLERALLGDGKAPEEPSLRKSADEEKELLEDVHARAFEFIKDRIIKLDWEDMQELVAGLLRAMGYKTRVSAPGSDRGKDIVASPDGFGFESPRIVVEVKHRPGTPMGSQEIRSFLGGRHSQDKGLYVSTGGFSKDARYEADRASIPLTLMDSDELVQAVISYYDRMDIETQRLLPLRKVYWPG